ncbi:MAG: hypothetical protein ACI8QZ_004363 [Chlamydiales bacterium]|jgi:hypothetical protein
MKALLTITCCSLLSAPLLRAPETDLDPILDPTPQTRAEVCATGCAAASSGEGEMGAHEFERLLDTWAEHEGTDQGARALDTLLFHGARAMDLGARLGYGILDPERAGFLQRELGRGHALLSVRLVSPSGEERLHLGPTRIPLGEKQHLIATDTSDLQPPEVSGTLRRVGVDHLWARL